MIPERDYFLAKSEVARRQQQAAEERAVRKARGSAVEARSEPHGCDERPRGAFGWIRRLSGARH